VNSREQRARQALARLGRDPRPEELRAISVTHSVGIDTLRRMTTTASEPRAVVDARKARRAP
jgi:hypothetical protein